MVEWRIEYFRESSGRVPGPRVYRWVDDGKNGEKMDDFQKQLQRLKRNPVFAKAFDKRRTEAEVAFQIRRLREAKGWSQKDLAKKVGCSQQAISAVEQAGYKRHSLPLLRRIAAVLDADVIVALVPRKAA